MPQNGCIYNWIHRQLWLHLLTETLPKSCLRVSVEHCFSLGRIISSFHIVSTFCFALTFLFSFVNMYHPFCPLQDSNRQPFNLSSNSLTETLLLCHSVIKIITSRNTTINLSKFGWKHWWIDWLMTAAGLSDSHSELLWIQIVGFFFTEDHLISPLNDLFYWMGSSFWHSVEVRRSLLMHLCK